MTQEASAERFLVDGEWSSRVSATDRGFTLGDGLFETMRVRGGRILGWSRHMDRLARGCSALAIPPVPVACLEREVARAVADDAAGVVRLTVTRGPGPRGYAPPSDPAPTRVIAFRAEPGVPASSPRPIRLTWCRTRLASQPRLAGIKHLNRLEQVLARAEWQDPAIGEGIMQAQDGRIIECVASNLFLALGDRIVTPALDDCGVAGVTRARVREAAAAAGITCEVREVGPDEVMTAHELFVTNAVRGVLPVVQVGERTLDAPGSMTRRLARQLEEED